MDCGKTERIIVERGKKINSNWKYFGKINLNSCQTEKFYWQPKDKNKPLDDLVKVSNPCYDPKIKPKYVEMWECGCQPQKPR